MTKTPFDNLLDALLEMENDDTERTTADETITADQRVDLFLRAMLGSHRECTAEERIAARAKVLGAMAADIGPQIQAKKTP